MGRPVRGIAGSRSRTMPSRPLATASRGFSPVCPGNPVLEPPRWVEIYRKYYPTIACLIWATAYTLGPSYISLVARVSSKPHDIFWPTDILPLVRDASFEGGALQLKFKTVFVDTASRM